MLVSCVPSKISCTFGWFSDSLQCFDLNLAVVNFFYVLILNCSLYAAGCATLSPRVCLKEKCLHNNCSAT